MSQITHPCVQYLDPAGLLQTHCRCNQESDENEDHILEICPTERKLSRFVDYFDVISPSNVFCALAAGAGTGAQFLCLSGAASFHDPPKGSALCQPGSNPAQPHPHRTSLLHGNGSL